MSDHEKIRQDVSEVYGEIARSKRSGCGCGCAAEPQSDLTTAKGYGAEELSGIPVDAVESSLGCGNPLAYAGVKPGDVVLDLGSGAGIDLLIAAEKVGPRGKVIGVDMTDDMIARARANIAAAGVTNVEVKKGIIEKLPVEDASVDWVISNCVINLSPEKDRVFREIARVLKPGGRMSVSDIVAHLLPDWVRNSAAAYTACIAGAIDESAYLAGLERAGLTHIEVTERYVYEPEQLLTLADSPEFRLPDWVTPEMKEQGARTLAGKVWSAKVIAQKPA